MYIRVSRGRIDPARYDELVSIGAEITAAVIRMPGCQSSQNGGDRSTGRTITVSTWDTQDHANVSREALGDVLRRVQATGIQLDPPEIYEAIP